jgi:hypothetical protein
MAEGVNMGGLAERLMVRVSFLSSKKVRSRTRSPIQYPPIEWPMSSHNLLSLNKLMIAMFFSVTLSGGALD